MNEPTEQIKIIHLEDRTSDAELVARELRRGGLNFELVWVKDKTEFILATTTFPADIILSDHSLPTINSFGALQLLKEHKIDAPVILVTSNTSEEIAVDVMKAGAVDYVLKDRLQRLPNAVTSAFQKHRYERERLDYLNKIIAYHDRYEMVSKATNDAIWDWDIKNDKVVWNHGIQTIFGYENLNITNSEAEWKERVHPDDHDRVAKEMQTAFDELRSNWFSNYRYRCANGSYKHVFDRAYILYAYGTPERMIGAMQDVTELTQYRESLEKMVEERTSELKDALKAEKELVDMKNKFVSVASHEFRTPLTTISMASGFIKKYFNKATPEKLQEKVENIEQQVVHMARLLDDVLMVGKSNAGKITTHFSKTSIDFFRKMAQEVVDSSGTTHQLKFSLRSNLETIVTDEKLMRHIIVNLLTNAIKFSPGASQVVMKIIGNEKTLLISVRDFGIGILPEELKNLFTPFSRASNATAIEGTGLGLSIVKNSVDLLGGKIIVSSLPGYGTTFKVIIPLTYTPQHLHTPTPQHLNTSTL